MLIEAIVSFTAEVQGGQAASQLAAADPPSVAAIMLLAVVQGVTEFLPVSSSGHLALARTVLDVRDGGLALDVALHLGTLVAIVIAFRRDVLRLFRDLIRGDFTLWIWLVVATLPLVVVGLFLKDHVEAASGTVRAAGTGLLVTAAVLLVAERARRRAEARGVGSSGSTVDAPRTADAVAMGLAQAVAVWPGVSRSGSTISMGLLRGSSAEEAARLSFLMSLPAISGAAILELPGALEEGFGGLSLGLVAGAAAVAGLVGFAALKTLLLVLRKGSFPWFAAYCAVLGSTALALQ